MNNLSKWKQKNLIEIIHLRIALNIKDHYYEELVH